MTMKQKELPLKFEWKSIIRMVDFAVKMSHEGRSGVLKFTDAMRNEGENSI